MNSWTLGNVLATRTLHDWSKNTTLRFFVVRSRGYEMGDCSKWSIYHYRFLFVYYLLPTNICSMSADFVSAKHLQAAQEHNLTNATQQQSLDFSCASLVKLAGQKNVNQTAQALMRMPHLRNVIPLPVQRQATTFYSSKNSSCG